MHAVDLRDLPLHLLERVIRPIEGGTLFKAVYFIRPLQKLAQGKKVVCSPALCFSHYGGEK